MNITFNIEDEAVAEKMKKIQTRFQEGWYGLSGTTLRLTYVTTFDTIEIEEVLMPPEITI